MFCPATAYTRRAFFSANMQAVLFRDEAIGE
jgi:hypothetical protein